MEKESDNIVGGCQMITKDTPLIEVLRLCPKAREIFTAYGMSCVGCMGSATETVANAARMHAVKVEELLKELNKL
ncbi:MAG: hypothetical protein H6Q73_603 [Firmicutes bacterium]|nr:hypothetical protein [Bacillota bacterium]